MIIGISGKIGSGKDTVGAMLVELGKREKINFEIKKFAAHLKAVASLLTGIPVEQFESHVVKDSFLPKEWDVEYFGTTVHMTVRHLLQHLGTDAMRDHLHYNVWVNALMKDYQSDLRDGNIIIPDWIITDVRFPNEFRAIKERHGILIKVVRNTGNVSNHISETALDYENRWDCVIDNNGTIEELKVKVEEVWNILVSGQEKKVPV